MRILRVAQKVYPESTGGGAYHVHAMSRDQAAIGHDVTVLTVSDDDSLPRKEGRGGYTIVRQAPTVEVLGNAMSVGVARFLWNADSFDVVHAHSHLYFSTNLAALNRRLVEAPLAITNHGLYSQSAPEWLFDVYLRSVGRWTFDQADVVFCYTGEGRERMRKLGVDSPIEVVANGVDTDRFTPEGPASDRIDHDGPTVLFVGRLVEGKRPHDAIEAVVRLREEYDAKLFFVGDGPLRSELEERGDYTELLGQVPYDEMPAIYRSGDVLLLPSRTEGLPRTVLEAFASGVPVVSSHLEQTAPIVRKAGRTAPVGDLTGYASALADVLKQKSTLGAKGRRVAMDEFRWEETVEKTTARLTATR